jgi:hypothetical protein
MIIWTQRIGRPADWQSGVTLIAAEDYPEVDAAMATAALPVRPKREVQKKRGGGPNWVTTGFA